MLYYLSYGTYHDSIFDNNSARYPKGVRVTRHAWERVAIPLALVVLAGLAVLFLDIKDDDTAGTLSVAIFITCMVPMAVWAVIYVYYAIRPSGWPE